jgi:hypothetical protein
MAFQLAFLLGIAFQVVTIHWAWAACTGAGVWPAPSTAFFLLLFGGAAFLQASGVGAPDEADAGGAASLLRADATGAAFALQLWSFGLASSMLERRCFPAAPFRCASGS